MVSLLDLCYRKTYNRIDVYQAITGAESSPPVIAPVALGLFLERSRGRNTATSESIESHLRIRDIFGKYTYTRYGQARTGLKVDLCRMALSTVATVDR